MNSDTICTPWSVPWVEKHMAAIEWIDAVNEAVRDSCAPPPAPIEELMEFLRDGGELEEIPALALLDELAEARRAIAALERKGEQPAETAGPCEDLAAVMAAFDRVTQVTEEHHRILGTIKRLEEE